ncbi:recombinase family protein [Luteipulveratus sp. YIM 133132]|uniref:recombinase family protein n=1 Tax=Luteipulveratus flavus TaxID=3031728 RepID=UPI0023B00979|nr:recombinase family protein [Luteipulveratus sp. YIM 133132]MDE9365057.1 recombinase family protein [Luteipulveratus sp. YIM 133132]
MRRARPSGGDADKGKTDQLTAAIYVRISDDKSGEAAGVERQETLCRSLCEQEGWAVGQVYVDNSVSATSGVRRPAFEQMLEDRPQAIVCWHQDRLVRKTSDLNRIIELGVPVHSVKAGTVDLATPSGRAIATTLAAWATFETEHSAERKRAAFRESASKGRKGWSGRRPYGYANGRDENGRPILIEREAEHLRHAFGMVRDGASFADIARYLNDQGETTPLGHEWHARTVRQVMVNPRNGGMRTYRGEIVSDEAEWEPIIPRDEWMAIIERAVRPGGRQKGRGKAKALLSSLCVCGVCGGPFAKGTSTSQIRQPDGSLQPVKRDVYIATKCGHTRAPLEWLDEYVRKELVKRLTNPAGALYRAQAAQREDADALAAAHEAAEARVRLQELRESYARGEMSLATFTTTTSTVEATITSLDAQAATYYRPRTALDHAEGIGSVREAWQRMDDAERRSVLAEHIESISIKPRGRGRRPMSPEYVTINWKGWGNRA